MNARFLFATLASFGLGVLLSLGLSENNPLACQLMTETSSTDSAINHEEVLAVTDWFEGRFAALDESGKIRMVAFDKGSRFGNGYHPRLVRAVHRNNQTLYYGLTVEPYVPK